ncbi:MAG: hypothetical protein Q7U11_14780, partial [Phenylobacterium sp.]|nr:hypothetical protein [Phenylobacterium sp.]
KTKPQLIASGNLGCITQIGKGTEIPIVHTAELLDWATGGPVPYALNDLIALDSASSGLNRDVSPKAGLL